MRILFAGEPLKGHLYPIIAIYEELRKITAKSLEKTEFMLISTKSDFLDEIFEETKVPYKVIMAPSSTKSDILEFLKFPIGFLQTIAHLFNYMPDAIFIKGGYVSIPVAITGWIFRIPIIIHESDAVPRPVDKFTSKFVKRIVISFKQTEKIYKSPRKVVFTGNPVMDFIAKGDKEEAMKSFILNQDRKVILILAGTAGAELINNLVIDILPQLLLKYQVIHQCGIVNYSKVRSAVEKMNISNLNDYHLFPFFKKRAADAYAACDLVISRAGANTVSEIMIVGKPSILIPLSSAVSDEQTKNAFYYSEAGAAILVGEKNLKPHLLLDIIDGVLKSDLKILEMRRAARQLAHPEAARKIAEEILKLAK